MKSTFNLTQIFSLALVAFLFSANAFALDPILRDYHSVRAAGMGDVRYTTGLYEENFFANPARSTDNPEWLLQLPQISVEASGAAISSLSSLIKLANNNDSGLSTFANNVGKPLSARVQSVFPGYYASHFITDKWSFGVAIIASAQTVAEVSQSGTIDPTTIAAVGPAVNLSRRFLDDRLSIGANAHVEFRGNTVRSYSIEQYLVNQNLSNAIKGGNGLGYDFDLGTTFKPHWNLGGFHYELGFAVNNILGGQYKQLGHPSSTWPGDPFQSNRSYSGGVSALHDHFWFFSSVLLAAELTDIGNNGDGSIYRCIHLGSEFKWKILAARLGVSQGYWTAGAGIDLKYMSLNVASYAEELGLNPGVMEDRRYAAELGFQI
jgi:hypothetical protein